jgi:O-antigen/teichoic acid export membrane protein
VFSRASGGLRGRPTVVVLDQAVSSASNFLLVLLVGRWLGPSELGAFALVLAIWVVIYGVYRAVVEDPMVVMGEPRGLGEYVAATCVVSGVGVLALGAGAAVLAMLGATSGTVVALAVFLPWLLFQDLWRRVAFMRGKPNLAVWNDLGFLLVQIACLAVFRYAGDFSPAAGMASWGFGALAGTIIGWAQLHPARASLRQGVAMLRSTRSMSVWLVLDFAVNRWARQAVLFIVAAVSGTAAVGAIQASNTLLGFTNVLVLGWSSAALAEGAARMRVGERIPMLTAVRANAVRLCIAVGALCGAYALFAPWVLRLGYGAGYRNSYADIAPIVALQVFFAACDLYPVTVLRIQRTTRQLFTRRGALTPIGLVLAWPLAATGLGGAAWATAVMAALLTAGAWFGLVSRKTISRGVTTAATAEPGRDST